MMRITKLFCFVFFMFTAITSVNAETAGKGKQFNWGPVMDAIGKVESSGNSRAVNGAHVGILQISPVLVTECNKILKSQGSKKRYSLNDRYSAVKSREMFVLIQSVHNPRNSVERAIRSWHGGINYSVAKTQRYYRKVMNHL